MNLKAIGRGTSQPAHVRQLNFVVMLLYHILDLSQADEALLIAKISEAENEFVHASDANVLQLLFDEILRFAGAHCNV